MSHKASYCNQALDNLISRVFNAYSFRLLDAAIPLDITGLYRPYRDETASYWIMFPGADKTIPYNAVGLKERWHQYCYPTPTLEGMAKITQDIEFIKQLFKKHEAYIDHLYEEFKILIELKVP